jgi:hypothetical protein
MSRFVRILLSRPAAACVVVAAVVSCGGPPATVHTSTQPPPGPSTAAFAFTTASQLSLVRNGAVAASVTSSGASRYPVFTDSGKYVAAADGSQIVAVGFAANSTRTIQANAGRVFAGGCEPSPGGRALTWFPWTCPIRPPLRSRNRSTCPAAPQHRRG